MSRRGRAPVRTPTILQMEAAECGAACLAVVLAHFGRWVTLEELRLACGVSRNGSKASNLLRAAWRYGLAAHGFKSEPGQLRRMRPPLILHWNFNHFVVLEGFRRGRVHLNDPAVGRITIDERELDESFTGIGLAVEPGANFARAGRKPSFVAALLSRLHGHGAGLLFILVTGLALTLPAMIVPAFSGVLVDRILLDADRRYLVPLLLAMAGTALVLGALTWIQQRALFRLESRIATFDAGRLLRHVLRLPIEFFTQRYAGDISSRLTISTRVAELLSRDLATSALSALLVVFFTFLLLRYDITMTAIGIAGALSNVAALHYYSRRRKDGNRLLQQEQGKIQGTISTGLEQIESVKATGSEADLFVRWAGYQAKVFNLRQKLELQTRRLEAVPPLVQAFVTAAILWIGSLRILSETMTVGELVAFQLLMTAFLTPVGHLVGLGARVQMMEGEMHRLDDILRYPVQPGLAALDAAGGSPLPKLSGHVTLRDVTFGYDRSAPPLIAGFSLDLRPGRRVALVGPSGSGKSTIARLVMGLYEPWSGEVRFDDRPRQDIPRAVFQASVASVDQSIFLFEGTVSENLTLWNEEQSHEEVAAAARDAAIHDEIVDRPGGYDGVVEEGGRNWSGGQRQRLEIARALVSAPTILVLDEATSALDPATERDIDRRLRRRSAACLIIAHRLSTIRDADEIIVLDQGRVAQRGTHDRLQGQSGPYAELIALL